MLQIHKMILWADARDEKFDVTVQKAYDILQILRNFGPEISPTFLTVRRKRDATPFNWTYENFAELVKKSVNKEGKTVFPDLGYTFSFFSSLINRESAGISMSIGITNPKFTNSFIVDFPQTFEVYEDTLVLEKLIDVFKNCVVIFEPKWGCIANVVNARRFNGYSKDEIPTTVHWLNFFGENIVNKIGKEKVEKAPVHTREKLANGYFLRLSKMPINDESLDDLDIQNKANKSLGL